MLIRSLLPRAARSFPALPLLLFLSLAPAANAIRPPELIEHPLRHHEAAGASALRAALPSQSLTGDPAPHPLDSYWVGMSLPTFHYLVTPGANAEFQGLLYLGGSFVGAGHIPAPRIVAWDGSQFVSAGDPGMLVQSLVAWNGALYAGGDDVANTVAKVSRWDGTTWTEVANSGPNGGSFGVEKLEVWNGDLVAIGRFQNMGGVPVSRAARFDGTTWHAMGTGLATVSTFSDLQAVGSELYAAVSLVGGIRRFDGTDWVAVGPGLNSSVRQLATDGTDLYASGDFGKAGADSVPGVGRWDGAQWHRVGVGTAPGVNSLGWWNGQLVAAVRDGASRVSRFDGVNWSGLGGPFVTPNPPLFLGTYGTKLAALGFVLPVPSGDAYSGAFFDGATWSPLREAWEPGMHGLDRGADAATVWDDRLVVVGEFTRAGTGTEMLRSSYQAMWDGSSWTTFGTGTGAGPQAIAATPWGTKLAVAGYVSATIPGGGTRSVATWDGTSWSVLVPGMFPYGYSAIEHLGDLIVGGDFVQTDASMPVTLNGLGRWTGSDWESVGGGVIPLTPATFGIPYALASWDGQLAVGGSFEQAGSLPVSNFAIWDGVQWSDAAGGLDGECYALEVWNGFVVAGGDFTHAGGVAAPGAAYWDGSSWHAMGDEAVEVAGLTQIAGTLYGVGDFRHADGSISNTVARWTGTNWAVLGSGARAGSFHMLWVRGYHGDLYAGGQFLNFGFGRASHSIIRLPLANTVGVGDEPIAARIALVASPNPGGRRCSFSFTLPKAGRARLQVFDAAGRVVATLADGEMLAGPHQVRWSTAASPGVYFARLEAPGGERAIARVARME